MSFMSKHYKTDCLFVLRVYNIKLQKGVSESDHGDCSRQFG